MNERSPNARSVSALSAAASAAAVLVAAAPAAIAALLITCALSGCFPRAADSPSAKNSTLIPPPWPVVKVELPVSNAHFPAGDGADVANAQCLICHSAGMVLRQPPLTQGEWIGEINKMRNAFGSPLPADQIEPLAKYLFSINGGQASGSDAARDGQAN
jgi:mono/diheme cytochrome c family protein